MSKTSVIYSNGSQECQRMTSLLLSIGGDFHEYMLNKHFTEQQFEMEFGKEATYPQVSIGLNHIGNMNETLKYMKREGLIH
tara:strand:- start:2525 stop:2767 length:243 start_codon:yes stop_codon:yes gene_type:complete